jgi:GNAT superfamily N-acetyltransferase
MMRGPLDNPFWSSLCSRHRDLALTAGNVARYPAEFAPFLGVASADTDAAPALGSLVQPGESVYLLGVVPVAPAGWVLEAFRPIAQMTCAKRIAVIDGPEVIELSAAHREDVLALTALVYPHYFRRRTMELGRYFGIYQDGRLAAMIGERLAMDGHQEMSAICTHPDFNGRGYARRLTALLTNDNLERGLLPFLHVSHENPRAQRLYEQLGYTHRCDIGFWALHEARSAAM